MSLSLLRKATNALATIGAISTFVLAGMLDGERLNSQPCNFWLFLAVATMALVGTLGSMAILQEMEMQKNEKPF